MFKNEKEEGFKQLVNKIKEKKFASRAREPLGKSFKRNYQYPEGVEEGEFQFGSKTKGNLYCAKDVIAPDRPLEEDPEVKEAADQLEVTLLADLLDSVPADADLPLLWAVTSRLSDNRYGRYSETRMMARGEAETPPIKDLAREALKRALGCDHEYDILEWRKEVVKRAQ